jgi:hypothetical protein
MGVKPRRPARRGLDVEADPLAGGEAGQARCPTFQLIEFIGQCAAAHRRRPHRECHG